jgi:hypothetical protein
MTTPLADKRLQFLNTATKELESDDKLDFDDVVRLCIQELKEWPAGSTEGARTEIWHFLRAAARRANHLIAVD